MILVFDILMYVLLQAVAVKGKELQLTNLFDHMGKEVEEMEEEDMRYAALLEKK